MLQTFYPDLYMDSAYGIDYEEYYRRGFRGIIFDIDNTLVEHGAPADERSIALMERLKKTGFQIMLLSNNKEPRVKMFNDKVELTADIFKDKNKGIFQQRANIPEEAGFVTNPYTNIGGMESWGFDGNITFNHNFTKDFGMTVRGNWTFARNNVTYWEQSGVVYPYQSFVDVPYGVKRGLISLGLFKDQADIESSPVQTYSSDVRPGDIKYKDVNGDGLVNSDDEVPLKYSDVPQIQYGFATEFNWKNWNVSILFEGVSRVTYFNSGDMYRPFSGRTVGNVITDFANPANRWISREYAEKMGLDPSLSENPNARFPRMSYGNLENNSQTSSFWKNNAKYLRLSEVNINYSVNVPKTIKNLGINSIDLSLVGNNLCVWDKIDICDPEQALYNGRRYPIPASVTLQAYIKF